MNNNFFIFLFLILVNSFSLQAFINETFLTHGKQGEPKIFINNRILANINGKPISTFDLMKKMDVAFYRQYPEYTSSIEARAQYYNMSWKYVLEDLVDKELILADAKESKIEVSNGDVRQEMELSFGPNIIANLDQAGITFEEAAKIMQEELIIQKMISGRVHAKAIRKVTPIKIRRAYEEFIKDPENAQSTQWKYKILTIKERLLEKAEEVAKAAYQFLMEGVTFQELENHLKRQKIMGRKGKVTISNLIQQNEKEISKDYKDLLTTLDSGMYSQPFAQKSRSSSEKVYRILYIKEKIPEKIPSLKEMELSLRKKLLDQIVDQETDSYLNKLREHYHIRQKDLEAYLPSDYQPFILN